MRNTVPSLVCLACIIDWMRMGILLETTRMRLVPRGNYLGVYDLLLDDRRLLSTHLGLHDIGLGQLGSSWVDMILFV